MWDCYLMKPKLIYRDKTIMAPWTGTITFLLICQSLDKTTKLLPPQAKRDIVSQYNDGTMFCRYYYVIELQKLGGCIIFLKTQPEKLDGNFQTVLNWVHQFEFSGYYNRLSKTITNVNWLIGQLDYDRTYFVASKLEKE